MRLKGGKVLLDLTSIGDISAFNGAIDLSNEELKLISEKGITYQFIYKGQKITKDFNGTIFHEDGGELVGICEILYVGSTETYNVELSLSNNQFGVEDI